MSSDAIAIQTAEAAGRPWVERLHEWVTTVDHKRLGVLPIMFGFANYLVPLMIGARDMAFPRLNAFSFWLTAFGGLLLYFSLLGGNGLYGAGNAPDVGWWAYAPLTSRAFSPGH